MLLVVGMVAVSCVIFANYAIYAVIILWAIGSKTLLIGVLKVVFGLGLTFYLKSYDRINVAVSAVAGSMGAYLSLSMFELLVPIRARWLTLLIYVAIAWKVADKEVMEDENTNREGMPEKWQQIISVFLYALALYFMLINLFPKLDDLPGLIVDLEFLTLLIPGYYLDKLGWDFVRTPASAEETGEDALEEL